MQGNTSYLYGYYGMQNSGDDALLLAAAWGASRYLQAETLSVQSPRPLMLPEFGRFPATLAPQQRFTGHNRLLQYHLAANSQHMVFGGGSILHCSRDINLMRHLMWLSGKGPHRAIGVGIGPFKNSRAEEACRRWLNECDFIGVRDQESLTIAKAIAPSANVELTFDLAAMLLEMPFVNDPFNPIERRGIGVALCPRERLHGAPEKEEQRLRAIARSLTDCYLTTGEPVFLIDFNGHSSLGDSQVHNQLHAYLSSSIPVFRINYDANPLRLMKRLSGLKAVVGMRLHASILAYLMNTPVLSLNYHSKCFGWANQIGMPQHYRFDCDYIDSQQLSLQLIAGLDHGFSKAALPTHAALQASQQNFLPQPLSHKHNNVGAASC